MTIHDSEGDGNLDDQVKIWEEGAKTGKITLYVPNVPQIDTAELSESELAGVAGVGTSTFKVLFKQSFGVSVHQYVIKRRVEHAMNLLSSGRVKLNDIAQKAGFVDQSHMGRCFRRLIGMTPGAVAREYRGAEV